MHITTVRWKMCISKVKKFSGTKKNIFASPWMSCICKFYDLLWKGFICRGVVKRPQCLEVMILQTTWEPPAQGFHPYSKVSLILSESTAFLSVPLSCPSADRKVHDSHGYWIQNVGMDLFSWNKEIFAIYSYSQTHRRSCSHKNRDRLY